MRIFVFYEPEDRVIVLSEDEIIDEYYPFWQERLKSQGKDYLISYDNCIEDWKVIHYAFEIPENLINGLKSFSIGLSVNSNDLHMLKKLLFIDGEYLTKAGSRVIELVEGL